MSSEPRNAALALHKILTDVVSQGTTVAGAWRFVLGCDIETSEFARLHGAVVNLVVEVAQRGESLPAESSLRRRIDRYLPTWYGAVVHQPSWNAGSSAASSLCPDYALDVLQGVGEQFQSVFADADAQMSEDFIKQLEAGLDDWIGLVLSGDLPRELASQVSAHVEQIRWLFANVHLFGYQPVAREVQALTGTGMGAIAGQLGIARSVKKRIGIAVGAVLFAIDPVAGAAESVDDFLGSVTGIYEKSHEIHEILTVPSSDLEMRLAQLNVGPPKAIEAPAGQRAEDSPDSRDATALELEDGTASFPE